MKTQRTPDPQRTSDPQILEMLAGTDTNASMAAVQRTRRIVLEAANEMREQRARSRRNVAVVVLTIGVLATLLTPAIWTTIDDYLGGEQFFELPGMIMALVLLLFTTVCGVLLVIFRDQESWRFGRHGRR